MPAALLLIGAVRHYAWDWAPVPMRGAVSKALGALAILCLIWVVYLLADPASRTRALLAVALWWSFEELQTALCSAAYAIEPWPVPPGLSICSVAMGADIGALSLIAVAALAWNLHRLTVSLASRRGGKDGHNG